MNNGKIFVSLLVVSGFIYERMLVSVIEKRKEKKKWTMINFFTHFKISIISNERILIKQASSNTRDKTKQHRIAQYYKCYVYQKL